MEKICFTSIQIINPNHIGVKYFLIVFLGGGGGKLSFALLCPTYWSKLIFYLYFELKRYVCAMNGSIK